MEGRVSDVRWSGRAAAAGGTRRSTNLGNSTDVGERRGDEVDGRDIRKRRSGRVQLPGDARKCAREKEREV